MRHELEVPLQRAGVGVERDGGIGVQVVARAHIGVPIRRGIPDAPDDEVQLGVIGSGDPGGTAALLPGVGSTPRLVTFFARAGNGVESPAALPGGDIVGVKEAADAVFAACDPGDHHVLDDQRRAGDRVAGLAVGNRHVPQHGARLRAQRDQVRIHGAEKHAIAKHRHAAVDRIATDVDFGRKAAFVVPVGAAGGGIESEHVRGRLADVHDAIDHDRCGLDAVTGRHLVYPGDFQTARILAIDLVQRAVPPTAVRAGIGEPVAGLGVGLEQALVSHLRGEPLGCARQKQKRKNPDHSDLPGCRLSDSR